MKETNNIHGLLSERELDRVLNTWQVPGANEDLAARLCARAGKVEQTEHSGMVSPLLKTAAALLLAAGLGVFVGLMDTMDTTDSVTLTVDLGDMVFGQNIDKGISL